MKATNIVIKKSELKSKQTTIINDYYIKNPNKLQEAFYKQKNNGRISHYCQNFIPIQKRFFYLSIISLSYIVIYLIILLIIQKKFDVKKFNEYNKDENLIIKNYSNVNNTINHNNYTNQISNVNNTMNHYNYINQISNEIILENIHLQTNMRNHYYFYLLALNIIILLEKVFIVYFYYREINDDNNLNLYITCVFEFIIILMNLCLLNVSIF